MPEPSRTPNEPNLALKLLLSLTAADALGAATEFRTPEDVAARFPDLTTYQPGSPFGFAPGEATDDSQMAVATLLGLATGQGVQGVLNAYLDWADTRPPDVGNLIRGALSHRDPAGGYRAWVASGRHAAGNGGLMRIAACNVAGFAGEELERQAVLLTALTHADPRCVLASVFLCALIEELQRGVPLTAAARTALRRAAQRRLTDDLVRAGLLADDEIPAYQERVPMAVHGVNEAVESGLDGVIRGQSGFVLDTLQAAVAHARRADWQACIEPAVRLGDDSDTVACVTGALVAARGFEVPAHLLPDLRLGHSWTGWERPWSCVEHYPAVVAAAREALNTDVD